jgi:hypothetical protein
MFRNVIYFCRDNDIIYAAKKGEQFNTGMGKYTVSVVHLLLKNQN